MQEVGKFIVCHLILYVYFYRDIQSWQKNRQNTVRWQRIVSFLDQQSDGILAFILGIDR